MVEWWNALSITGQFLAMIAIPATVILVIQTVMLIIGAAGHGDADTHADSADADHNDVTFHTDHYDTHDQNDHIDHDGSFRLFTVRGIVSFLCVFGWTGLLFLRLGLDAAPSVLMALIPGVGIMFLVAYALRAIYKMQSSGNMEIEKSIGTVATVYMNIPPIRSGQGKVNALVSGRYGEFDAITDEEETIHTGEEVEIIDLTDENTLVVSRKAVYNILEEM